MLERLPLNIPVRVLGSYSLLGLQYELLDSRWAAERVAFPANPPVETLTCLGFGYRTESVANYDIRLEFFGMRRIDPGIGILPGQVFKHLNPRLNDQTHTHPCRLLYSTGAKTVYFGKRLDHVAKVYRRDDRRYSKVRY